MLRQFHFKFKEIVNIQKCLSFYELAYFKASLAFDTNSPNVLSSEKLA